MMNDKILFSKEELQKLKEEADKYETHSVAHILPIEDANEPHKREED